MATRATRYRSHSPAPSPTHTYEQLPTPAPEGTMALETRTHEHNYGGRSDLTLPPFTKNLVVGSGVPNSPRNSNYNQSYHLSPPKDLKIYSRSKLPSAAILDSEYTSDRNHYSYDDNYSDFAQTKPICTVDDSEPAGNQHHPLSSGSTQWANGSHNRSLPPLGSSYNQPQNTDTNRHRQFSINSLISSPDVSNPIPQVPSFTSQAHGNGTLKKRKKSFEQDDQGGEILNDGGDREKNGLRALGNENLGHNGVKGNQPKHSLGLGVGLEDPDVRMAAEALGDLRADLNHGSSSRRQPHLHLSTNTSSGSSSSNTTTLNSPLSPTSGPAQTQTEAPLLDLLQSNPNPVLRAATGFGRLSAAAYSTSKAYSPRWRYAAEQVESVAKGPLELVSKVGKSSGLEGLMRRSLGGGTIEGDRRETYDHSHNSRRSVSSPNSANGSAKKRKTSNAGDAEPNGEVSSSASTLREVPEEQKALQPQRQQQHQDQSWQTRLILSSTGIGVMSEESLKSLKFCLEWLRWANNHIAKCLETLTAVLDEYERNQQSFHKSDTASEQSLSNSRELAPVPATTGEAENPRQENEERRKFLMGRMELLKSEVMKTLKKVINVVDSYAGGALVGETRAMVKRQLLHLPKRLQIALVAHTPTPGESESAPSPGSVSRAGSPALTGTLDPTAAAKRVVIVAKEGLMMMQNISKLVEYTLSSAEEWCEKLGSRKRAEAEESKRADEEKKDVKMVEAPATAVSPKDDDRITSHDGEKSGEMHVGERDDEGDVKMES